MCTLSQYGAKPKNQPVSKYNTRWSSCS